MKYITTLSILTFLLVSCQSGKTSNLTLLSERIPADEPLVFGEGIVSTDNKEFSITFNPQMDEMFFTRRRPEAKNEIYTMKLVNGKWSAPELAFFATNTGWDFEPHINPKGDKLYFGSTRPLNDTIKASGMHQWVSEKNGNGWGQPKPLGAPFVNRFVMYPSATDNETLYFTSREEGVDREDSSIFFSIKEGDEYASVKNMAEMMTLPGKWIAHPYIAPDESYLIFDSQKDSESDDCDLYIAFNESGTWTEPYNLGPKINTDQCEMCASVSPDGNYLFFHRGGQGTGDMYWVDFLQLKKEVKKSGK
ncbi:hypothetical protein ACOKFD_15115 [Flagellimonas sp. S174]|uniref:hypothetical protein n=1 Tax=Flagellimonas sp. S174 TaxID=3410790 RepID=UPI003BF4DED4